VSILKRSVASNDRLSQGTSKVERGISVGGHSICDLRPLLFPEQGTR